MDPSHAEALRELSLPTSADALCAFVHSSRWIAIVILDFSAALRPSRSSLRLCTPGQENAPNVQPEACHCQRCPGPPLMRKLFANYRKLTKCGRAFIPQSRAGDMRLYRRLATTPVWCRYINRSGTALAPIGGSRARAPGVPRQCIQRCPA